MSTGDEDQRLRTPPSQRFAGPSHLFSLGTALDELRGEDHQARDGHRQVTLFHRGAVTQVLFDFEQDGFLEKHSARGLVTLHVVEGCLNVEADGQEHEVREGHILILNPGVPHDVRASQPSAMVLTVHLEKKE
jgi:quercetin dioxygenase-like cupin family protein